MIDEVFADVKDRMTKAVEAARESFATVRTGRANPSLLQGVQVDYYGTPTPLPQLASVANQDARSLLITPYDKGAMKDIEQAIRDMPNLGANPSNDGSVIRVTLPELTEERRKQIVKQTSEKVEDARIALRQVRQDAFQAAKRDKDAKTLTEDDVRAVEKSIDKSIADFQVKIDEAFKSKEKDILTI